MTKVQTATSADTTRADAATDPAPTTGTEIVLKDGRTIVVRQADPNEVQRFLTGGMLDQREDTSEEIAQRMVSQVFTADNASDILGVGAAVHVRDYLDKPVTVLDVTWNKSSFVNDKGEPQEGGLPVFAAIHAINSDGEKIVLTTGAFMPCAQLYRMQVLGVLSDLRVKFIKKDRPTANGFFPINMTAAD